MEVKHSVIRPLVAALIVAAIVAPIAGCGSKDEDYDPAKIAKPQPGNGPPPMGQPSAPPKPATNG